MSTEERNPRSANWLVAVGHLDPNASQTSLQLDSGQIVSIPTSLLLGNMPSDKLGSKRPEEDTVTIPVIAEELVVTKRLIPIETVRVVKTQEETTARLEVPLLQERWEITRLPKETEVVERYGQHEDGETMIYPRFEERLFTRKVLFLVEEIHARRIVETTVQIIEEDLVHDVISVERTVLEPDAERVSAGGELE